MNLENSHYVTVLADSPELGPKNEYSCNAEPTSPRVLPLEDLDVDDSFSSSSVNLSDVGDCCINTGEESRGLPSVDGDSGFNERSLKKVIDHQMNSIFQNNEALLQLQIENDRSKRFEYLLQQTEIYGHFMKPAYEEALKFANNENGFSQENNQITGEPGSEDLTAAVTSTKNGRFGKGKKKIPELPLPKLASKASGSHELRTSELCTLFKTTPPYIKWGIMRDYQVRGLNWLISLHERGLSGILADEMGLGKTVQTISLLGYLKHYKSINGPHLIIAPKSTLPNWMNELKRWCPSLKAICLIGGKDERPAFIKTKFLPKQWNICVTSYEMARIEKSTLAKVIYQYIVIDEAQKIKNENSLLAVCVRQLKSSGRLLLTGTPLQNNLHELWALLNFLLPDVFSSSDDFDSWFNENNCIGNQTLVERLHAVLRPFLLRRIKSDVEKSLPPKNEMRLYVHLTPMQREWYKKILMNDINILNNSTGRLSKLRINNVLMQLRKVCNHPYLFPGAEPQPFTTDYHIVANSGKMIVLDKLLMKLKMQGSRVLLFSQMTRLLDILEDYCIWRDFEYCRLDGNTDYDIRQEDIDAFNAPNSSKFIYLLSTRAGGLGINLATANIVILFDSDWNPQVDLQAMDRAHRIGQTKEVKVFRFVVQDSAEEKIVERAITKLHLDRMVIQQGRLVGAQAKDPSCNEVLNLVRFGAEKILKSEKDAVISDADVDTILAQSKLRSDEFERRLMGMDEVSLQNLTIEQVEFDWKKSSTGNERDTFKFEGQDYRELRKRKTRNLEDDVILPGKRRKDLTHSFIATSDDEGEDSSFLMNITDREGGSPVSDAPVAIMAQSVEKKPALLPLDFQFDPIFVWELHWQEMDNFYRGSPNNKVDLPVAEFPEPLVQLINTSEHLRLKQCEPLNGVELREKKIFNYEGFRSWKKKNFQNFIEAVAKHGSENLQAVAKSVRGKQTEEVVQYSQVFWLRCHELFEFEEIMNKLNMQDFFKERRALQQNLLERKIKASSNLSSINILFEPNHWKGKRFSDTDDTKLLMRLVEIGLQTSDVFATLRARFLETTDEEFSPFLRARTSMELQTRFNILMYMIEKEYMADNVSNTVCSKSLKNENDFPFSNEVSNTSAQEGSENRETK